MLTNVTLGIYHVDIDASKFQTTYGTIVYTDKKVATIQFYDSTFKGGKVVGSNNNGSGGQIFLQEKDYLYVDSCEFIGGEALSNGGILELIGTAEIKNSTFTGGSATNGGALYITGTVAPKLLENVTVTGATKGSGIYVYNTVTLAGKIVVKDNEGGNLKLSSVGNIVEGTTAIDAQSEIGITAADGKEFFSSETDRTSVLKPDSKDYVVKYDGTKKVHVLSIPKHEHCVCGGLGTVGDHKTCASVVWTGVSSQAEIEALITDATTVKETYVYLTQNIQLTKVIANKKNNHVHICLNGFKITAAKNARALQPSVTGENTNAEMSICDCSEAKTGEITAHAETTKSSYSGGNILVYTDGTFNMYGGKITNGRPAEHGGNVSIQNNSSYANGKPVFNMYGGEISGGISAATKNGGNVYIYGKQCTFNMYGGTIKDGMVHYNTSGNVCGGNVYVGAGTFNMEGGTITGGTCVEESYRLTGSKFYGGNIAVSSSGVLNVKDGTISNGIAYNGGNIAFITNGKVNISGGTISGGQAYNGANFYMTDGTAEISGTTHFTGGKATFNGANIYQSKGTLYIKGGTFDGNASGGKGQPIDNAAAGAETFITGGTFKHVIVTFKGYISISGGYFQQKVWNYYKTSQSLGDIVIRGGYFVTNPTYTDCGRIPVDYQKLSINEEIDGVTYKYKVVSVD